MIALRKSCERGYADHGWLKSFHSFSFADYYDPKHMGFGNLRVINEDRIAPGTGFGTHGHRDMEIISYVLAGSLAHKDSMGTGSTIEPGDVQRMSAGTGVRHSEFNGSDKEPVHFLQIWIQPDAQGIQPSYEQKRFERSEKKNLLRLIASPGGADGSVHLHADAKLFASVLDAGASVTYTLPPGRHAWMHVAKGTVAIAGHDLTAGDAASTSDAGSITLVGGAEGAEVLLFDLA